MYSSKRLNNLLGCVQWQDRVEWYENTIPQIQSRKKHNYAIASHHHIYERHPQTTTTSPNSTPMAMVAIQTWAVRETWFASKS